MIMILDKSKIKNDIKWFLSNCHIYTYPAKSTLIHQGEKVETLLYILKGIVTVFTKDEEGKEVVLYHLKTKDFIGERGLFEKSKSSKYWIKAKTSCEVAEISYKNFFYLINVNKNILIYLTHRISQRLQFLPKEGFKSLDFIKDIGKVAKIILNMKKESKNILYDEHHFTELKLNIDKLSKLCKQPQEMVKKALNLFKQNKLIDIKKSSIIIYKFIV